MICLLLLLVDNNKYIYIIILFYDKYKNNIKWLINNGLFELLIDIISAE